MRRHCKYCFLGIGFSLSIYCSSQIFIEEGLDRGIDVTVTSQEWGAGVSTYDFNQDGFDDLTIGNDGDVLFFINDGAGSFDQVFLNAVTPNGHVKGIVWADINNDGKPDLLITGYLGDVRINKNLGELIFEDITATSGISMQFANNYGISLCDIDKDGFLDIQLCRYSNWYNLPQNPTIEPERWSRLYQNNGDETFTDITQTGAMVISPRPVFQGVFADFNNNGWPDNYTIVDRVPGNYYFKNNLGSLMDITNELNVSYPMNDWMSNSVADYDNDGDLDIFMTNAGGALSTGLMENVNGDGFERVENQVGLEVFYFGWGAQWIDFDNDGWQDLFFSTESLTDNYLFLNTSGDFTETNNEIEVAENVPCFSVAKGDFNQDGFYDLIVQSQFPNRSHLLINQVSSNHYIKVTPKGVVSNRDATGTWLRVYTNDETYVHYTTAGDNYISQNSQHWIFGLGEVFTEVDSVEVLYPSGHQDTYYNLAVDSHYVFTEGETYTASIAASEDSICSGEEVVLNAGNHSSYDWSTGDNSSSITISESGTYEVIVTNEYGIKDTAQIEITVLESPFIEEVVGNNLCHGEELGTIELTNLSESGSSIVSWSNGESGLVIDSLAEGQYDYEFIDSFGCSTTGSATLVDPAEMQILSSTSPETDQGQNGSIEILIFGGVEPYTILLGSDTVPTASINGLNAGNYEITVFDQNGCSKQVEVTIELVLNVTMHQKQEQFVVFPNPTTGQFEIDCESVISDISVYDISGLKVGSIDHEQSSFDISELKAGVYFIQVTTENSGSSFVRVVKE